MQVLQGSVEDVITQRLQNDRIICVLPPEYLMLAVDVTEISEVQLACRSVYNMCAECCGKR